MAEIGGAALGAAASVGAAAYTTVLGFSARHDQSYDSQAVETRQLIDRFEKLRAEGDLPEEDYDVFLEKKETALQSGKEYRESISRYKETSAINVPKKFKMKSEVRKRKQKVRRANQELHDYYYDSASSCGSDASSLTAQSGSPPDADYIREWANDVSEAETAKSDSAKNDPTTELQAVEDVVVGCTFHDIRKWADELSGAKFGKFDDDILDKEPVAVGDTLLNGRCVVKKILESYESSTQFLASDRVSGTILALKTLDTPERHAPFIFTSKSSWRLIWSSTHPGHYRISQLLQRSNTRRFLYSILIRTTFEYPMMSLVDVMQCYPNGAPSPLVKQLAKQILLGLDFLHENHFWYSRIALPTIRIIDIHSSEQLPIEITEWSTILVKLCDLEKVRHQPTNSPCYWSSYGEWAHYRAPEHILYAEVGPSANVWSVGCILFDLICGEHSLFYVEKNDDTYGHDKFWNFAHAAKIIEVLGPFPKRLVLEGSHSSDYFDQDGTFVGPRFIHKALFPPVTPVPASRPIQSILEGQYDLPVDDAKALFEFLQPMLHIDPAQRSIASEMVHHPWLDGVDVSRSEIDLLDFSVDELE